MVNQINQSEYLFLSTLFDMHLHLIKSISGKNKPSSKITPSQHMTGGGFEIYGDSSTPGVLPNATGQIRNNPLDPSNNRENMKQMQKIKGTKV